MGRDGSTVEARGVAHGAAERLARGGGHVSDARSREPAEIHQSSGIMIGLITTRRAGVHDVEALLANVTAGFASAAISEMTARGHAAARLVMSSGHVLARRFYERRAWAPADKAWNDDLSLSLIEYRLTLAGQRPS